MQDTATAVGGRRDALRFEVRSSHRELLEPLESLSAVPDVAGEGLVMVPAVRTDNRLATGVELALGLRWPLLVLCSRDLKAPAVRERLRPAAGLHLTAADLVSSTWLRAPRQWSAVHHRAAEQRLRIDTNRKRNLALAAAAMTGRRWVLFVDDDVTGLTLGAVETALTHLARRRDHRIVGWPHEEFPDNSVVHHARRDVMGWDQDVFVGGGALLVRLDGAPPAPFPPVYNEDWLFLLDALARREVVSGPPVGQVPYRPYADPERAALEEFGDVLGEGLMHLVHEGLPVAVAKGADYWSPVLEKRRKLLGRITERARELSASGPAVGCGPLQDVVRAMGRARGQHAWATPAALASFVRAWRDDQETWADFYGRLPGRETLKQALVYLGLHDAWIVTAGPGYQEGAAGRAPSPR
jgi:hypothetical protein